MNKLEQIIEDIRNFFDEVNELPDNSLSFSLHINPKNSIKLLDLFKTKLQEIREDGYWEGVSERPGTLKTSRALSSGRDAFRIEKREDGIDLVWQANGEQEAIYMILEKEDVDDLLNKLKEIK